MDSIPLRNVRIRRVSSGQYPQWGISIPKDFIDHGLLSEGDVVDVQIVLQTRAEKVLVAQTPRSAAKRNRMASNESKCSKRVLTPVFEFFDSGASNAVLELETVDGEPLDIVFTGKG